jgi:aspartate racemase
MSEGRGRCIGLIGGLGPGATVHYYQHLLKAHAARQTIPDLVIIQADVARVLALAGQGDIAGLAEYMGDFTTRLERAGAQVAVIPAVTPHICMPALKELSAIPLISVIDVVRAALIERGLRRIALFGTRFTVESDMFGQLSDFDVVRPGLEDVGIIHQIYVALVETGRGTEAQAETLREIARGLIDRESVDAIVLAGTELALIVDEDRAGYPIVDCASLHIAAIANYAVAAD